MIARQWDDGDDRYEDRHARHQHGEQKHNDAENRGGDPGDDNADEFDLNEFRRQFRNLARRLAGLAFEAESLSDEASGEALARLARRPRTGPPAARGSVSRRYVKQGVNVVLIERVGADRFARIENIGLPVNFGRGDRLPDLLKLLSLGAGKDPAANGIVPVKSHQQLIEAYARLTGKPVTPSGLRNHVHRLRQKLTDARIDPRLVETIPGTGYRLRLREGGQVIDLR